MRSSFFELNVAVTGLHTAQRGIQVTTHNMANSATPGFSRQYAKQRAGNPINTFGRLGMVGTGSEVFGVGQIRNTHLDHRFWNERPIVGKHSMVENQLTIMESMFGELNRTGFSANFNRFFDSIQGLNNNTADATNRNSLIQSMNSLSQYINNNATSLLRQQQNINREIGSMVAVINNLGEQINNLNNQIERVEMTGGSAHDLRDRRALLVDELSGLVNITVTETNVNGSNRFTVHIDGNEFINNTGVNLLQVTRRTEGERRNPHDADGLYQISFANGRSFNMYSPSLNGELKGLIDMRDGNGGRNTENNGGTTIFRGIPYYIQSLNNMIKTFSNAFNYGRDHLGEPIPGVTGHVYGYNANNENTGIPLFIGDNIFNFKLNPEIARDPSLLATSLNPDKGESSNDLILGFLKIRNYQSLFREGTLFDFINAMTSEIAMDLENAYNFKKSQTDVLITVNNQRLQVKSVDINEEMINLLSYQHQFRAASKLISTINEIYDNMINRMGV